MMLAHSLAACPVACLDGLGRQVEERLQMSVLTPNEGAIITYLGLVEHPCQEEGCRSLHTQAARRMDYLRCVS